jgi:hypothetical protein
MPEEYEFSEPRKRQLELVERQRRESAVYDDALERPRGTPSQVYSLRLPVERVAQLREVAETHGVTPSALIRSWVVEKLDQMKVARRYQPDEDALLAKVYAQVPRKVSVGYSSGLNKELFQAMLSVGSTRATDSSVFHRFAAAARSKRFRLEVLEQNFSNINKQSVIVDRKTRE